MDSTASYHSLQPVAEDQLYEHNSEVSSLAESRVSIPQAISVEGQTSQSSAPSQPPSPISSRATSDIEVPLASHQHDETQLEPSNDRKEDVPERSAPKAGRWAILATDTWTLELIAGFVSFGAFASIIGVLWSYDNRPVPVLMQGITVSLDVSTPWQRLRVDTMSQLNAVIAFLATISRTAIMLCIATVLSQGKWLWFKKDHSLMDLQNIENASRGPLGSAILLSKFKCRSVKVHTAPAMNANLRSPMLYLAAMMTVVTLGFDPFVQQLLTIQTRVIPQTGMGITINSADYFRGFAEAMEYKETDLLISAAMLSNLGPYAPPLAGPASRNRAKRSGGITQSLSPLMPTCPGGNCIWDPYYAIDVCTRCRDTTEEMQFVVAPSSNFSTPDDAWSYIWHHAFQDNDAQAEMTWDLIPKSGNSWQVQSNFSGAAPGYYPGDVSETTEYGFTSSSRIVNKLIWPLNFQVTEQIIIEPDDSVAYIFESIQGTFAGIDNPVAAIGFAEFGHSLEGPGAPVLQKSLECALTYCVKEFNRSVVQGSLVSNVLSEHYGKVFDGASDQSPTWAAVVNGTNFSSYDTQIGGEYYGAAIATLLSHLLGNETYIYAGVSEGTAANVSFQVNWTNDTGFIHSLYPDAWPSIDLGNITTVLENMEATMSDIMQQYANSSVTGMLAVTKPFVVVRWPWITLPATSILVGLIIFGMTVWETRRLDAPKWSSSLLPLLYRHFPRDSGTATGNNGSADGVTDKEARSTASELLDGSNLVSRFEIEAEATTLRFSKVGLGHRTWQLQSLEVVYKDEKSWWHRLKWW